ncbi:stage II sporulation protein M [Oleiharenicola lentus]|uniref:stage II sporulation protein M n=1 Tax=Oleiharenicola lentus TaxID=2508720 RepID=UPI003F6735EE
MIIDLNRFVAQEERYWKRLEEILARSNEDSWREMPVAEVKELDYLYRRAAADLARVTSFSAEPEMRQRLERIVARAYAEIHGARTRGGERIRPWRWLAVTLPQTFRRNLRGYWFACLVTLAGFALGGFAVAFDPDAKEAIMPFSHLLGDPSERVAEEEAAMEDRLSERKAAFAGHLMAHNTKVTLFALALGLTWGLGTVIIVFYNGVILGAVVVDYLLAGEATFLFGWLLPHGIIEIPAILVGAQAGFVLAGAVLGRDDGRPIGARLRAVSGDVTTLAGGAALMLVWAGVVESYLSQYHEPAIPYAWKIAFGVVEGGLLVTYYFFVGRKVKEVADER